MLAHEAAGEAGDCFVAACDHAGAVTLKPLIGRLRAKSPGAYSSGLGQHPAHIEQRRRAAFAARQDDLIHDERHQQTLRGFRPVLARAAFDFDQRIANRRRRVVEFRAVGIERESGLYPSLGMPSTPNGLTIFTSE